MVNVLGAVPPTFGMAFAAALIRNLLGLGSLLAFPGSMIGALLCGVAYRLCPKLPAAYAGEVFGTGILGGLASYPIAAPTAVEIRKLGTKVNSAALVLPMRTAAIG